MSGQKVTTEKIVSRLERVTRVKASGFDTLSSTILYRRNTQYLHYHINEGVISMLTFRCIDFADLGALCGIISLCTELKRLTIVQCNLSDISLISQLTSLKMLTYLDLRRNQIESLTPLIDLKFLRVLVISGNPISEDSLQIILANMALKELYAERCEITRLEPFISCTSLVSIDLSYNQINCIPEEILVRHKVYVLQTNDFKISKNGIRITNNPIDTPPIEIVTRGKHAMLRYYDQLEQSQKQVKNHLFEAKMLVIGEPGAGKTSLVRKVENPESELPKEHETTHGIDVLRYDFKIHADNFPNFEDPAAIEGKNFRVNLWDFGGQEIYKATHRFFLSSKALYALVSDSRNEDTDFNYWLHIVEMLGGNSPVIIVLNEKHKRERNFDADAMRRRYPNIKEILSVDLADDDHTRLNQIRLAISQKISGLPHIGSPIPATWLEVREKLEAMIDNTIKPEEYLTICSDTGIPDKDDALLLSQYFHDIGVFLHFQEDSVLKNTIFLKPNWATNAIYKVLDCEQLQQNDGLLMKKHAKEIWHEEEFKHLCDEFLQLMQKFHLAFALKVPGQYIVPAKLPTKQPSYNWQTDHNLQLRYKYDEFMPKGLLFHLMVELQHLIKNQHKVWRRGMLVQKDGAVAEITESYNARDIKIRIMGQNQRDLLIIVMDQLDKINAQYDKLKVEKLIPCNCTVCKPSTEPHFYDYSDLNNRIHKGKQTVECKVSFEDVDVEELLSLIAINNKPVAELDVITPEPEEKEQAQTQTHSINRDQVFISYSHKDKAVFDQVNTHLKVLNNEGIDIKVWQDSEIKAGDFWFDEIKTNLSKAKVAVLLVSTDFLASDFIAKEELPDIIKAMQEEGVTILSLILKPCRYAKHKMLGQIQSINPPDRPLSGLSDHDTDVEILKLIEAIEDNMA